MQLQNPLGSAAAHFTTVEISIWTLSSEKVVLFQIGLTNTAI